VPETTVPFPAAGTVCNTVFLTDSDDCLADYGNAMVNGDVESVFCPRCTYVENGGEPLQTRCSLCCEHCSTPSTTSGPAATVDASTAPDSNSAGGADDEDNSSSSLTVVVVVVIMLMLCIVLAMALVWRANQKPSPEVPESMDHAAFDNPA